MKQMMKSIWFIIPMIIAVLVTFNTIQTYITHPTSQSQLLCLEMLGALILMFLPFIFNRIFTYQFPKAIIYFYWVFMAAAAFLGTGLHWMGRVPYYDKLLHFISAILFTLIGYIVVNNMLNPQKITHPILYSLLVFMFALACCTLWEFYEFTVDAVLDLNLQQYRSGANLYCGRNALQDTMQDLLFGATGSALYVIYHYIKLRNHPHALSELKMIKKHPNTSK